MMLSAAPQFEDVFLHRCLGQGPRLAYAEIDATDPDADSVSQWFDLSGWPGVIAAPLGDAAAWCAARPNAIVLDSDARFDWAESEPFGFIRFARSRDDAAAIIALAQPLIVISPGLEGVDGYACIRDAAGLKWFGRAGHAAGLEARLRRPLTRDEFIPAERQAATLARLLSLSEAAAAQLTMDHDRAHQQIVVLDQALQARDQDIQALHREIGALHQDIQERDREIQARDREIQARDREIQARDQDIQALHREIAGWHQNIQALHRELGARDQDVQARDREIQARDRQIEAQDHEIQARGRMIETRGHEVAALHQQLSILRPEAERLARLVLTLDWPDGPRALRAVLPLARVLRKVRSGGSAP